MVELLHFDSDSVDSEDDSVLSEVAGDQVLQVLDQSSNASTPTSTSTTTPIDEKPIEEVAVVAVDFARRTDGTDGHVSESKDEPKPSETKTKVISCTTKSSGGGGFMSDGSQEASENSGCGDGSAQEVVEPRSCEMDSPTHDPLLLSEPEVLKSASQAKALENKTQETQDQSFVESTSCQMDTTTDLFPRSEPVLMDDDLLELIEPALVLAEDGMVQSASIAKHVEDKTQEAQDHLAPPDLLLPEVVGNTPGVEVKSVIPEEPNLDDGLQQQGTSVLLIDDKIQPSQPCHFINPEEVADKSRGGSESDSVIDKQDQNIESLQSYSTAVPPAKAIENQPYRSTPSIDLENLCNMLEKTNVAGQTLADQNVLLFIGATGSGKTTTVLYLAGTKFEELEVQGFDHFEPKDFAIAELEAFKVAPGGQSVTRTIQTVTVEQNGKCTFLADSPGFNDSEGVEMDIVNGLGLIRALRRSKSVKPVLVFNADGLGDRFRSFSDTLDTITRMIGFQQEIDFSKFSYLFTRCDKKKSTRIHQKLASYHDSLLGKRDTDKLLLSLLEDMIRKTTPKALFIDPMNENHLPVLQELCSDDMDQFLNSETFHPFVTPKASGMLSLELKDRIAKLEKDLQVLNFDTIEQTLQIMGRLAVVLPEALPYSELASSIVETYILRTKNEACQLVFSLWEYEFGTRALFSDALKNAASKISTLVTIGSYSTICRLNADPDPINFVSLLFDEFIRKRPIIQVNLDETDALQWSLTQLNFVAKAFGDFPGGNGFRLKLFEDFDRLACCMVDWLRMANDAIHRSTVDVVMVEKHIVYVECMLRFVESEGIADSEGKLVFDSNLSSTLKNLCYRARYSIKKVQTLADCLSKMLVTENDIMAASFDQLTSIVESREFLLALSSTQCLPKLIDFDATNVLESVATLDRETYRLLERFSSLFIRESENLTNGSTKEDDLASSRDNVQQLIGKVEEVVRICSSARTWTLFNSQNTDVVWRQLVEATKVMKLVADSLDKQASRIVETLSEATRAAKLFRVRLTKEIDKSALIAELCEAENWSRWQSLVAIEDQKRFFSRLIENPLIKGVSSLFGWKSCSVDDLENAMMAIVDTLHGYLSDAMKRLSRISRGNGYVLLRDMSTESLLLLAFVKIPEDSTLGQHICNHIDARSFRELCRTSFQALTNSFTTLSEIPTKLIATRRYIGMNNLLMLLDESKHCLGLFSAFARTTERGIMAKHFVVELDQLRISIEGLPRIDRLQDEVIQSIQAMKLEIEIIALEDVLALENDHERTRYFKILVKVLEACSSLAKVPKLQSANTACPDTSSMYFLALDKVNRGIEEYDQCLSVYMATFPLNELHFPHIYKLLVSLKTFAHCFRDLKRNLAHRAILVQESSTSSMTKALNEMATLSCASCSELACRLILLKKAAREISCWGRDINCCIDACLANGNTKSQSAGSFILDIALELRNVSGVDASVAQQLLSDHDCFEGVMAAAFGEATSGQGISYVLNGLGLSSEESEKLGGMYETFGGIYTTLVLDGLGAMRSEGMVPSYSEGSGTHKVAQFKNFKADIVKNVHLIVSDPTLAYADQVVSLSAHLFAYWSLLNCSSLVMTDDSNGPSKYLMKPHAAQVIAVWKMLNCPSALVHHRLEHHLVELKTGEGKSIVLGVTATILALWGYHVSCVCYSSYLSDRDHLSFRGMFTDYDVEDRVWYGTLNGLYDDWLGSHASVVGSTIRGVSAKNCTTGTTQLPRVMLVDEVDVFFGADVFGRVWSKSALLSSKHIQALLLKVWDSSKHSFHSSLADFQEFHDVLRDYPSDVHSLIKREIRLAVTDAKNVKSGANCVIPYHLIQGDIFYKYFDGLERFNYGYETRFLYVKEYENGRVSEENMKSKLYLRLKFATLSLAEFPHSFDVILGVTGTLQSLDQEERKVLEEMYGIRNYTYIPSVFGRNKLKFAGDTEKDFILCDSKDDHFFELKHEILRRRDCKMNQEGVLRPVMVFFDCAETVLQFYESQPMESLKKSTSIVIERTPKHERNRLFLKATEMGSITLMVRDFGRGTDFKCFDRRVLENGGVHVIQAFFSTEISEEIQIKGRCARQGADGSLSMVLNATDLERDFQLSHEDIETMRNTRKLYSFVSKVREARSFSKVTERKQRVEQNESLHYRTLAFKQALEEGTSTRREVLDFLAELGGQRQEDHNPRAFSNVGSKASFIEARMKRFTQFKEQDRNRRHQSK